MKTKKGYFLLLWCFSTVGVLAFILGNSLRPASVSGAQSAEVYGILQRLLYFLPFLTHGVVRVLAHVAEFALLGAHFFVLPFFFSEKSRTFRVLLFLVGALFAIVDEGIQAFVPGRAASMLDVLTDGLGYLLGAFVALCFYCLLAKRKKKGERYASTAL